MTDKATAREKVAAREMLRVTYSWELLCTMESEQAVRELQDVEFVLEAIIEC